MGKTVKTLDLNIFEAKYLDVTLLDGSVIHLKKPTQGLAINMALLGQHVFETIEEQVEVLNDLLVDILNHNKENKVFTIDDIADWEIELKNALITAYNDFTVEIQSDPF